MVVAVTGAAGYPGSHMLISLEEAGEEALAIDTPLQVARTTSRNQSIMTDTLEDGEALGSLFLDRGVTEVIHFSGAGFVAQSLTDPLAYYRDNTIVAYEMMIACEKAKVERFVLSSTASVYGVPERMPIHETTQLDPISPFGSSMAMAERIVSDVSSSMGRKFATLRYFNPAGADPLGRAGELGRPRHLIKVVAQIVVGTRKEKLQIFGDDYSTPDGTCIRDYVHVSDLADAHLAALEHLRRDGESVTLNLGYGYGASVLEVIAAAERVSGVKIDTEIAERRPGDPPLLIADNAEMRTVLDWSPRFDDLDYIVKSAIEWEERCQKGLSQ